MTIKSRLNESLSVGKKILIATVRKDCLTMMIKTFVLKKYRRQSILQ